MSVTVTDLATVVAELRAIIADVLTAQMPAGTTVLDYHPIRLEPGALPAVCLDMATIRRIDPDEGDSQLGSRDWHIELPIEIYVAANEDVQNPGAAMLRAQALACQLIATIDDDPQLGNWGGNGVWSGVQAVIASVEPFIGSLNGEGAEPVLGYEAALHAFLLIPETT